MIMDFFFNPVSTYFCQKIYSLVFELDQIIVGHIFLTFEQLNLVIYSKPQIHQAKKVSA